MPSREKFVPKTYMKCKKCNDVIHSSYSGEFVSCKCQAVSVDETFWYCRLIGEPADMERVDAPS